MRSQREEQGNGEPEIRKKAKAGANLLGNEQPGHLAEWDVMSHHVTYHEEVG